MTLLVPSGATGTHAPSVGSDGVSARRDADDGEFADALSEAAGKGGKETDRKDGASKAKAATALRFDARDAIKPDDAHAVATSDELLAAMASEKHTNSAPSDRAPGTEDVSTATITATASKSDAPAATSALDALIALGTNLTVKSDPVPSAEELLNAGGGRNSIAHARSAGRADKASAELGGPIGPDFPGEEEGEILPARVVREEKHFQPVGRDAQRLAIATAGAADDRRNVLSVGASSRTVQEGALQREPAIAPRAAEIAAPVLAAASADQEPMPGSVGIQIADRVQQALGSAVDKAPPPQAAAASEPNARPVFAPAIRTLKLELNPAALGSVTIMLTGGEDTLRIHLEAELAETVGKVEQDRGALSARLNGAGYSITELTVARLGAQGAETDSRDSASRHNPGQGDGAEGGARESGASFAGEREGRRPAERQSSSETGISKPLSQRGVAAEHIVSGISYSGRFRPV